MISFIMMAKNEELYIKDAILELQKENNIKWELIVIDDHSTDKTFDIVKNISDKDSRIKIYKNKYIGKVMGTNYGYSLTTGEIIKCIDADDILLVDFFREYQKLCEFDVHCHDALIVNSNLETIARYNINPRIISLDYDDVVSNLISIPKAFWSFKRHIGDKIFPMPSNLPLEDEWISMLIKKNCDTIYYINKPLYLYRQHTNQDFGGILNYNIDKVVFRANRLIKLIDIIENEQKYLIENIKKPFKDIKVYLELQSSKASILKILVSNISFIKKLKLILILHFPGLATYITKLKWWVDKTMKKNMEK